MRFLNRRRERTPNTFHKDFFAGTVKPSDLQWLICVTNPQETFSFSHSAAKLWPYLVVCGFLLSFFLNNKPRGNTGGRKNICSESKWMQIQIYSTARFPIAVVLHTES